MTALRETIGCNEWYPAATREEARFTTLWREEAGDGAPPPALKSRRQRHDFRLLGVR